jgi:hypothetical protein
MSLKAQQLKSLSQTVTVDANVVSVRDSLSYSPPSGRALSFVQGSLWPLMVIAVAALSSVLWTAGLLWLIGHAFW